MLSWRGLESFAAMRKSSIHAGGGGKGGGKNMRKQQGRPIRQACHVRSARRSRITALWDGLHRCDLLAFDRFPEERIERACDVGIPCFGGP